MIEPNDWEPFEDERTALLNLKKLGLISPNSNYIKEFKYSGGYAESPLPCVVKGIAKKNTLVIEVNGCLHCLSAKCFASMQTAEPTYTMLKLSSKADWDEYSNYVVIDLESTGYSANYNKIIEIGCVKVKGQNVVETFCTFVNPGEHIPKIITEKTGISDEMVKNAPSIEDALIQLIDFTDGLPYVAHNATFDMSFLSAALFQNIKEYPDIYCVDTLALTRKLYPQLLKHSLEYMIEYFNLDDKQYHRAMSDARCTQKLFEKCREQFFNKPTNGKNRSRRSIPSKYNSFRPSDIIPSSNEFDENHPLYGKSIVFTGELSFDRKAVAQLAINVGAKVKTSVSAKTDYLVVGKQDKSVVGESGISTKEAYANVLNSCGKASIIILDEVSFFNLIGNEVSKDERTTVHI